MPIHFGDSKKVKEVYFGSTKIKAIHKGADLVWRSGPDVVYIVDPTDSTSPSTYGVDPQTQLDTELTRRGLSRMTVSEIPFKIDLSRTTTAKNLFFNCGKLTKTPEIINTDRVTDISYLFNKCATLTTIPEMSFPKATNASYAFAQCLALTSVGPIRFDTIDVNLLNIFYQTDALQEDKAFLAKTNWWQWWDSTRGFTSNLGRTFKYPPFYDSSLNHIPYAYDDSNASNQVVTKTVEVPPWAKFVNIILVSAGRAGQNGNGGGGQKGLGGGTAGMFVQTNIPVTAASVVSTVLERRSFAASGSAVHPPNTDYSYTYVDGVGREAIGSRLQNSGVSTTQDGSTIDFTIPGPWTSKGLLIGSYLDSKTGYAIGWKNMNGESFLTLNESPYASLQSKITTGPGGTGNAGYGEFGAGGAGGKGGIFGQFTPGGAGGPATVRMVFSPINSNDW